MKMVKKFGTWSNIRLRGFTLIECLLALLVISGSVLLFQSMSQVLSHEVAVLSQSPREEWLLFSEQLRYELEGAQLIKVEGNKLYVKKAGKDIAFGQSRSDDFRKTASDGRGYQPMLYGLSSSHIQQSGQLVTISVVFHHQMERTFTYVFEKTS